MAEFIDNTQEFDEQAKQLERRRALARSLIEKAYTTGGEMVGRHYVAKNPWQNFVEGAVGSTFEHSAARDATALAQQEQTAARELVKRLGTPGTVEQRYDPENNPGTGPLVNGTVPMTPEEESARRIGVIGEGMAIPSLRQVLQAQLGQELDYPEKRREREARAAEIAAQKEAERLWREQQAKEQRAWQENQNKLYRRTADQISASVNARNNDAPGGGKPLTAAQEKAALELGSNRSNLQMLSETFKDEYAGDMRSTLERKAGEVLGGIAPQSTQDMTRWWANQAMFDELPQRHELFGATLTAGEKSAWAAAAISPNMSPAKIRERLAIRQKIYDDNEGRMRASLQAGGKSVKQFDAAVGNKPQGTKPAGAARVMVRSKAEYDALPAGTKWETPDGKRGTK